jgi:hypothetical protein
MFSQRSRRGILAAALATATLLTAGCATETTYHPAVGQGFYRTGFSDRQIEPDRWLVTFAGNTVTPRDTVERYLLFRAAELTLQQGSDYFVMVDRDTDRQSRTYSFGGFGGYGPYGYGGFGGYGGYGFGRFGLGGYWGPSWRYHSGFGGWGGWGGFGDPFFGPGYDVQTVDRVEAEAQIVVRRGPIPAGNTRAFDARRVVQTLGPSVVLPGQERGRRYTGGDPYVPPAPAYGRGPGREPSRQPAPAPSPTPSPAQPSIYEQSQS